MLKNAHSITIVLLLLIFLVIFYMSTAGVKETWEQNKYFFKENPVINATKLFDLDFNYILNSDKLCDIDNNDLLAIIIVTSYFGNVVTRNLMRQALSLEELKRRRLRRVFLLGEAPHDKQISQTSIIKEHAEFNDIIQGNFIEAYRNLTYKHVMGLKWVSEYCPNATYVIKMDDDIVFDINRLAELVLSLKEVSKSDFIAGYVLKNYRPERELDNKWYVTKQEYSQNYYPKFISGWFYVTSPETSRKIVALSGKIKYFWIDDVYVTGILASILKIKLFDISRFFTPHAEFLYCCMEDVERNINCDFIIGPNGGDASLFLTFNEKMKLCAKSDCRKGKDSSNNTCIVKKKVYLGNGTANVKMYKLK